MAGPNARPTADSPLPSSGKCDVTIFVEHDPKTEYLLDQIQLRNELEINTCSGCVQLQEVVDRCRFSKACLGAHSFLACLCLSVFLWEVTGLGRGHHRVALALECFINVAFFLDVALEVLAGWGRRNHERRTCLKQCLGWADQMVTLGCMCLFFIYVISAQVELYGDSEISMAEMWLLVLRYVFQILRFVIVFRKVHERVVWKNQGEVDFVKHFKPSTEESALLRGAWKEDLWPCDGLDGLPEGLRGIYQSGWNYHGKVDCNLPKSGIEDFGQIVAHLDPSCDDALDQIN